MILSLTIIGWFIKLHLDLGWMEHKKFINEASRNSILKSTSYLVLLTAGLGILITCPLLYFFKHMLIGIQIEAEKQKTQAQVVEHISEKKLQRAGLKRAFVATFLFFIPILGWWFSDLRWFRAMRKLPDAF